MLHLHSLDDSEIGREWNVYGKVQGDKDGSGRNSWKSSANEYDHNILYAYMMLSKNK